MTLSQCVWACMFSQTVIPGVPLEFPLAEEVQMDRLPPLRDSDEYSMGSAIIEALEEEKEDLQREIQKLKDENQILRSALAL